MTTTRDAPALTATDLVVEFPAGRGQKVHAVSGVCLEVAAGETLGILGESGCGKSTVGRSLIQLPPPDAGTVRLGDLTLTGLAPRALRRARARMQIIMQDPVSALNPRRRVKDLVWEGRSIWGAGDDLRDQEARVDTALRDVGLDPATVRDRRPHELSGGQCQRVCVARALMLDPEVLICDEPVSSLDVSVQAQILNLLQETTRRRSLSMVFIAHDVSVVKNISDRVMVMYLGKVCEVLPSDDMQHEAAHPYTRLLLASLPQSQLDPAAPAAPAAVAPAAELPSPLNPPSGCRFRTRCPLATDLCAAEEPAPREIRPGHRIACHHAEPRRNRP
ncbi:MULTISPECIES: oligopeptide/dipeptide ABC transporter ATP-binding protein [Streptomyces]|uniref:Oligopeptide transport ATP-binding protein OppF n=1 Tax=Streptomyces griseus TaxID=1911 RepID=A0A380PBJ1_STRGR|nr:MULTISPECIES: ABC transporter ATP-binding protein [Streptomyces]WSU39281.1 ABC transporter ATP-binding protein [Streptomyces gougerotii]MDQ0297445.1 peptide/nickel transport system ATP-binding protein [Streptomyces sp. DSM 41037]PJM81605.1 peptide ABC transporter ATP-binding protein [Streptomyces sp. TSRI0384-2]WPR49800.1 ABC transporter ATP-binding protein [Streptomyces sp. S399]SUP61892.1 Oligopeptide transport ATP-binding protein OppF [Streptomyces griseus]